MLDGCLRRKKDMGSVMVVELYNEKWPEMFNDIKSILSKALTHYESIEHIGSTSIPGMIAKPIIDIDIIIENEGSFEIVKKELGMLGYEHVGDQEIPGREVFKRIETINQPILNHIKHHLYVCVIDSQELKRHIMFRDRLRNSESLRNQYNEIKEEILKRVGENNREGYVELKEKEYRWFFESVIRSGS